jgi:hypothetical protein
LWYPLEQLHQFATFLEELFHFIEVATVHIVEVVAGRKDGTLGREHNTARVAIRDRLEGVHQLMQMVFREGIPALRSAHRDRC